MDDLAIWILTWDVDKGNKLLHQFMDWDYPHVRIHCDVGKSEAQNYNHAIKTSEAEGFKYILVTDSDVKFLHQETIPAMYEYIIQEPSYGSIRPWREGEPPWPDAPVVPKYVEDGTALMWRLNTGAYYDNELLFTGWADLDHGSELAYRGYLNLNDRRWPVLHKAHGDDSAFRNAVKKRNKLILDFKWELIGRDKWQGVEAYNATAPLEKRIPTLNQLVAMTDEELLTFRESVHPEHGNIWLQGNQHNPNLDWSNPLICGYSTRERHVEQYGY